MKPTYVTRNTKVWFLRIASDSNGEVHEQRVEYHPGSPFPPTHFHPSQDEHFEVETGEMLFVVDGAALVVSAGSTIDIPRGTPHKARNASADRSAVVRWETRPALRSTEFFAVANWLGDDMGFLEGALLAHSYRDVFRLTGAIGALLPLVAGVANLFGRRLPS